MHSVHLITRPELLAPVCMPYTTHCQDSGQAFPRRDFPSGRLSLVEVIRHLCSHAPPLGPVQKCNGRGQRSRKRRGIGNLRGAPWSVDLHLPANQRGFRVHCLVGCASCIYRGNPVLTTKGSIICSSWSMRRLTVLVYPSTAQYPIVKLPIMESPRSQSFPAYNVSHRLGLLQAHGVLSCP